jgi:hypothetical protein
MNAKRFTRELTALIRTKPFQPFTIVLKTGERIEVDDPRAIGHAGDGTGGFITPQMEILPIDCKEVRELLPAPEAKV